MRIDSGFIAVFALAAAVGTASAQTDANANVWRRGTTASGIAGVTTDGSRTGPAVGAAVGWELTRRLAIEGDGTWLELGDGLDAFAASLKTRVRLLGRRPVDPFVHGGIGFYRASFAATAHTPPHFYQRRMGGALVPGRTGMSFTDPSLVAGGGVNIFLTRHLALRPAVEATVVMRNGHRYVLRGVTVQGVFHFEERPVTPSALVR